MAVTNWFNHHKEQGNIEEMTEEASFARRFYEAESENSIVEAFEDAHQKVPGIATNDGSRVRKSKIHEIILQTGASGGGHYKTITVVVEDITDRPPPRARRD
jgi:hypothetical protein